MIAIDGRRGGEIRSVGRQVEILETDLSNATIRRQRRIHR